MKIKQHYVWQKYLTNWSNSNLQVYCLRNNNILPPTVPNRIAKERYFYRLGEITKYDLKRIEQGYVQAMQGEAKEYAEQIIVMFNALIEFRDSIRSVRINSQQLKDTLGVLLTNFEENYHDGLERSSSIYLKNLANKQKSFYKNPEDNDQFNLFLTTQYVRTKKIQETLVKQAEKDASDRGHLKRTISVYRFITAHTFAMGLNHYIDKCSCKLLINNTEIPFITGDQPVINTRAETKDQTTGYAKQIELYYPITPEIAVLIDPYYGTNLHRDVQVSKEEAKHYNDLIFDASHEAIFAKEQEHLLPYLVT